MRRVDANPRLREEKLAAYAQTLLTEAPYDIKVLYSRKMEMWEHAGFYPFPYRATPGDNSMGWRVIMSIHLGTCGFAKWQEWGGHNTAYRIYVSFSSGIPEKVKEDISFVVSAKRV